MKSCTIEGCTGPHRARGYCSTHYNQRFGSSPEPQAVTCTGCGAAIVRYIVRDRLPFCERACQDAWRRNNPRHGPPVPKSPRRRDPQTSLITEAMSTGDQAQMMMFLAFRTWLEGDCWIWQGRCKDGYPIGPGGRPLHRCVVQIVFGDITGQAVHHICANTRCVNPSHLQPISQRDNVAEMLQRRYYLDRIGRLESALAEHDPFHPLLRSRAPCSTPS